MGSIIFIGIGILLVFLLGKLLVWPIKKISKLVWNGVIGGITLVLFNLIGGLVGLNIVITPLKAIVVGFLGIPGVILLLLFQLFG